MYIHNISQKYKKSNLYLYLKKFDMILIFDSVITQEI